MWIRTLALLTGVAGFQQLSELPDIIWLATLAILPLARCWRFLIIPAWLITGLAVAWGHAAWQSRYSLPANLQGQDLLVTGVVVSIPEYGDRNVRFRFAVESLLLDGKPAAEVKQLRLYWYGRGHQLRAGERWQFRVRLKRPHGFMNPGGFDYESWLFQQGVQATGYVRKDQQNRMLDEQISASIVSLRQDMRTRLLAQLESSLSTGLILALSLGDRSEITPHQWEVLRQTGTGHLLAISGLHIGLIATLGFWLGRWLASASVWLTNRIPAQLFGAGLGFLLALIYSLLAGFSIPTQRALIMVAVVMGSWLLRQPVRPGYSLSLALRIILVLDPMAVLSAGFWLSFSAVSVLWFGMGHRVVRETWLLRIWRPQWLIAVGLLPLSLLFFQQSSLVAPLANLIAIPVVGLLAVPLILAGVLLSWFSGYPGQMLLWAAAWILERVWQVLEWFAQWPMASWSQGVSTSLVMGMAVTGAVLILMPRGMRIRRLGLVMWLPLFLQHPPRPDPGAYWLNLMDVGQGLSAVVQTRHHTLIFDTGPAFSSRFDTGKAVLVPYLLQAGINQVDRLIISHGDNDHIGGMDSLIKGVSVASVMTSVPDKVAHKETITCERGQQWIWDDVTFRILHPSEQIKGQIRKKSNNHSCVLLIAGKGGRTLIPGDIEKKAERKLLKYDISQLQADILVAPHHGSQTSSTRAFIAAVDPSYVLFSAGYRNRFHHPSAKVYERYQKTGAELLRSSETGTMQFRVNPGSGIQQSGSYRLQARRYWHHK